MKGDYKPIKGLGTGRSSLQLAVRHRLYAAPDHLLLVQSTGYTEDYKRVFYRDIRYVVARKDQGQLIQGFIAGGLFLGAMLLTLTPMPWWGPLLFGLPFAIWFVVNLAKGPTCRCHVNTDVQTLELPTPRRVGKVEVLIAFLNTKISPGQPEVAPAA